MKNLRNIKYIVVHCTATPPTTTVESIKRYWKEQRGWGDTPGYHYLIQRHGNIVQLLDESKNSYGVYAHNSNCISLAYIGGIDKDGKPLDNRSDAQKHSMFDLIVSLTEKYPQAQVLGHRDFAGVKKACPCFDVKKWLGEYEPDLGDAA
ncbi:MAG: N-acetylmuramoyl-L-alanine amidase [Bacteroidota bacterium]|nr:N-acetylmuramoyl-L-alanine amidase [Bacteroidota bacterium]MDP3145368.1 N-acetylmuramoyl-L-alanine amidase [Bacteroidota bacterium]